MRGSIQFFGGATRGQVTIENGHSETWAVNRDVWFDRDIDGGWLVWAGRRDEAAVLGTDEENNDIGAIVVKDPMRDRLHRVARRVDRRSREVPR